MFNWTEEKSLVSDCFRGNVKHPDIIVLHCCTLWCGNLEFLHNSAESTHQLFNAVYSLKLPFPWEVWGNWMKPKHMIPSLPLWNLCVHIPRMHPAWRRDASFGCSLLDHLLPESCPRFCSIVLWLVMALGSLPWLKNRKVFKVIWRLQECREVFFIAKQKWYALFPLFCFLPFWQAS